MYEKDGEKYFIVDSHMHYWDATPANWVPGAEQYAKGWIECFHAYQSLGPKETHWTIEKFEGYTEDDLMKDVFEDGHVDIAIFQPTYLKEWYREGFNTTERNAALGEKHPGKFIANTRFDPRDGDEGLAELRRNVERYGSRGLKLYTAEWNNGSRGYKLSDPAAYRFLEGAQDLGIKNVHVHKGPTIWPLDKDAFDVSDVDHAATDFPDLNFIVEHVGLPRIEDFCFMATQEPNVYAGLSVVIGGLMHARPEVLRQGDRRADVLGRRGQDDVRQRLRHLGAEVAGRGVRRLADAGRRRAVGLRQAHHRDQEEDPRPQRRQALRHQGARRVPAPGRRRHPRRQGRRPAGHRSMTSTTTTIPGAVYAALGTVRDPELDEPITTLGFVASCTVSPQKGRRRSGCACRPTSAPPTSPS